MRRLLRWSPLLLSLCALTACSRYWTARFSSPTAADVDQSAPFVKCHLPSGDLYVLTEWSLSDTEIRGRGLHYDLDRHQSSPTPTEHVLSLSEIALIETNRPESFIHATVAVLGIATAASLAVTAVCATNPKTCFGSCPTFYALSEGQDASEGKRPLMAEGFSASVARSMEETDVDALVGARLTPDGFLLEMRNEALETHFVQSLRIGVVHSEGRRVLREGDRYWPARALHEPLRCQAWGAGPEQAPTDCRERVRVADGVEYVSETDGHDLAAREEIRLRFPHPAGALGIAVRARNTLLNTFLFYQGLAYMGRSMGDYLMLLEAHPWAVEGTRAFLRTLGGIDAEVKTRAGWRPIGSFEEIGPIARDVQLWSLPGDLPEGDVELRLTGAGTVSTISHGWLAIVSLPLWLGLGITSTVIAAYGNDTTVLPPDFDQATQFARYPQGMPGTLPSRRAAAPIKKVKTSTEAAVPSLFLPGEEPSNPSGPPGGPR